MLPRITSPYGERVDPFGRGGRMHHGIDVGVATGTPALAVLSGTVYRVRTAMAGDSSCGNQVAVHLDNGWKALYCHLSAVRVRSGSRVQRGQVIGLTGASGRVTGPHLHFALYNLAGDSFDPMRVLPTGWFRWR